MARSSTTACADLELLDPNTDYGLVLSLHGVPVEGFGQVRAYSDKDWAYIIAPTNRRLLALTGRNGVASTLASLDNAVKRWNSTRQGMHLTGHSMGGHEPGITA